MLALLANDLRLDLVNLVESRVLHVLRLCLHFSSSGVGLGLGLGRLPVGRAANVEEPSEQEGTGEDSAQHPGASTVLVAEGLPCLLYCVTNLVGSIFRLARCVVDHLLRLLAGFAGLEESCDAHVLEDVGNDTAFTLDGGSRRRGRGGGTVCRLNALGGGRGAGVNSRSRNMEQLGRRDDLGLSRCGALGVPVVGTERLVGQLSVIANTVTNSVDLQLA
jgi:hypothetical protein